MRPAGRGKERGAQSPRSNDTTQLDPLDHGVVRDLDPVVSGPFGHLDEDDVPVNADRVPFDVRGGIRGVVETDPARVDPARVGPSRWSLKNDFHLDRPACGVHARARGPGRIPVWPVLERKPRDSGGVPVDGDSDGEGPIGKRRGGSSPRRSGTGEERGCILPLGGDRHERRAIKDSPTDSGSPGIPPPRGRTWLSSPRKYTTWERRKTSYRDGSLL